jgi:hypothetical protein
MELTLARATWHWRYMRILHHLLRKVSVSQLEALRCGCMYVPQYDVSSLVRPSCTHCAAVPWASGLLSYVRCNGTMPTTMRDIWVSLSVLGDKGGLQLAPIATVLEPASCFCKSSMTTDCQRR